MTSLFRGFPQNLERLLSKDRHWGSFELFPRRVVDVHAQILTQRGRKRLVQQMFLTSHVLSLSSCFSEHLCDSGEEICASVWILAAQIARHLPKLSPTATATVITHILPNHISATWYAPRIVQWVVKLFSSRATVPLSARTIFRGVNYNVPPSLRFATDTHISQKCRRRLQIWGTRGWNEATSILRGPTILERHVNRPVIWCFLLGACELTRVSACK
jgi:hypothetical protein